jgi:hypothetical protein
MKTNNKNIETSNALYTVLPAVIPPIDEVNYSEVKQKCIKGISPNLCDKVVMKDYGLRCKCVVDYYTNKLKECNPYNGR